MTPIQSYIAEALHRHIAVYRSLLEGLDDKIIRWKSNPDKWCLLEIVCHLYDEECLDFRSRAAHVLEHPELPMTPIDPVGWVTSHQYMEQSYNDMLQKFLAEREQSVVWLQNLQAPHWGNTHNHPRLGSVTAGMFLANWLAHDYLHIRQINRVKYEYLQSLSGEDLSYAGNW